jgi:sigma-E factor negative regulatory protein RseB
VTAAALLCAAAAGAAWTAAAAAAGQPATAGASPAAATSSASGTAASADDPRSWLLRAYRALDSRNYRGVFVHEFAGETETLRIVHRVGPDGLAERLQSMDGSGREFIRQGSQLYCYLPDRHMVLVERSPDAGPLLSGLLSPEGPIGGQYRVRQVSRTRALGRMTRVIAIEPKDQLRYGYRVWIDEATAMPVRMQLRDERGRVLEQIVFTELVLPAHIAASELVPAVNARNYRWVQQDAASPTLPNVPNLSVAWQASALPPGFRMTVNTRQMLPGGPAEHLVFSDGLASVSVFVQLRHAGSPTLPTEDSASLGTSSAYTVLLQNYRVTVVGQVPPQTVREIAGAFRSAAPAPAFADSGLGIPVLGGGPDATATGVPLLLPGLGSVDSAVPGMGAAARSRVGFGPEPVLSPAGPPLAGALARPTVAPGGPHRR